MGKLFHEQEQAKPRGFFKELNTSVMLEFWEYLGGRGCPHSSHHTNAGGGDVFDELAGLTWRDFWDAFPCALADQLTCLEYDTIEALILVLATPQAKQRLQRHAELHGSSSGARSPSPLAAPSSSGTAPPPPSRARPGGGGAPGAVDAASGEELLGARQAALARYITQAGALHTRGVRRRREDSGGGGSAAAARTPRPGGSGQRHGAGRAGRGQEVEEAATVAPAVWAALHELLTEEDEDLLKVVMGLVAATQGLAPAEETAAMLASLQAVCPQPPPQEAVRELESCIREALPGGAPGACGAGGACCCVHATASGGLAVTRHPASHPRAQLVKVVASSGYSRVALAAAATAGVAAGGDGWRAAAVDMRGVFRRASLNAALERGVFGSSAAPAPPRDEDDEVCLDDEGRVFGRLRLLGACAASPLVVLLAEIDAAMVYEEGQALGLLLQRLLTALPRAVVVATCSTDSPLAECVLLTPAASQPLQTLQLPDGNVRLRTYTLMRSCFLV